MITAEEARKGTFVDMEWADAIERNTDVNIEQAMAKGMTHVKAWTYSRCDHRWMGDVPDAVIDELDRRYRERGFELSTEGLNAYTWRVIRW